MAEEHILLPVGVSQQVAIRQFGTDIEVVRFSQETNYGLHVGDLILTINGRTVSDKSEQCVRNMLQHRDVQGTKLQVRHKVSCPAPAVHSSVLSDMRPARLGTEAVSRSRTTFGDHSFSSHGSVDNATVSPDVAVPVGLINFGNSCYFNVILQVLCHTYHYLFEVLRTHQAAGGPLTNEFVIFLRKYLAVSWNNSLSADLNAKHLLDSLIKRSERFAGMRQQDCHELLRHLLDGLRCEEQVSSKQKTLVDNIFGGCLITTFSCNACGNPYHLCEQFLDISLCIQFPEGQQMMTSKTDQSHKSGHRVTTDDYSKVVAAARHRLDDELSQYPTDSLQFCLQFYTRIEELEDTVYYCPTCNPDGDKKFPMLGGTKQTLIFSPPAILTLHLKRFTTAGAGVYYKIYKEVFYPDILDMTPYCSQLHAQSLQTVPVLYSLYAVITHVGDLRGGHYTAYVKTRSQPPDLTGYEQTVNCRELISTPERLVNFFKKNRAAKCMAGHKAADKPDGGQWYRINDDRVEPIRHQFHFDAYMLFYERIN